MSNRDANESTRRGGQPTKLTPELQKAFIDRVRSGAVFSIICDSVGISRQTYYNWLKLGRERPGSEFEAFLRAVKKAVAETQIGWLIKLEKGAPGWQSIAWLLERRFPQHWAEDRKLMREVAGFLGEQKRERHAGKLAQ